MDLNKIKQQAELGQKAMEEMKIQNRNFEQLMDELVKKSPKEHQQEMENVRILSKKAIELAKQGKGDEAQQIIKDFRNGR